MTLMSVRGGGGGKLQGRMKNMTKHPYGYDYFYSVP